MRSVYARVMLFLLPPSETKAPGGNAITIHQAATTFGALNATRLEVLEAYKKSINDSSIDSAPTMAAIERYTGTLYSAIHGRGLKGTPTANNTLTKSELQNAKKCVLIQSALFGLIGATDPIPEYKLSPGKLLAGLNLKKLWNSAHEKIWPRLTSTPIIDLRSKAYAELAVIPAGVDSYSVEVFLEHPDGTREQMNHFNKKAKGQLVRAALTAEKLPESIADLKKCAKQAGLKLDVQGKQITLLTTQAN